MIFLFITKVLKGHLKYDLTLVINLDSAVVITFNKLYNIFFLIIHTIDTFIQEKRIKIFSPFFPSYPIQSTASISG